MMANIWHCESGAGPGLYNSGAVSPGGDYGIPQINRVHSHTFDMSRILAEPAYAIAAAYKIYGWQGVGAWFNCARKLGYQ